MALQLGVPERGETTKTGVRQGARPDFPLTRRILEKHLKGKSGAMKLFDLSPSVFRDHWAAACEALGWYPGPPHSLRHSGPSFDAATGYRNLDAVRTRGRWRAKTSVLRYQKAHVLVAAEAAMPKEILEAGTLLMNELGERAATCEG